MSLTLRVKGSKNATLPSRVRVREGVPVVESRSQQRLDEAMAASHDGPSGVQGTPSDSPLLTNEETETRDKETVLSLSSCDVVQPGHDPKALTRARALPSTFCSP